MKIDKLQYIYRFKILRLHRCELREFSLVTGHDTATNYLQLNGFNCHYEHQETNKRIPYEVSLILHEE